MHDLMIALGFVAMILSPCVLAMFTLPGREEDFGSGRVAGWR